MQKDFTESEEDYFRDIDIVNLIRSYIDLKKVGSNYVALCPFHHEKTPSFKVSKSKQIYHCYGCGVSGNAIDFLMRYEGEDFFGAVEILTSFDI